MKALPNPNYSVFQIKHKYKATRVVMAIDLT